jgi:hypothetical protein
MGRKQKFQSRADFLEHVARFKQHRKWRGELFRLQKGLCAYCRHFMRGSAGRTPTLDHVIPLSKGGADSRDNVVAACEPCNVRKDSMDGDTFHALLALERHAAPVAVGLAFSALIALRVHRVWKSEKAAERAARATAQLLDYGHKLRFADPIHPDQDCTGDMPPKSGVRLAIEAAQDNPRNFAKGGQVIPCQPYEESRWRARYVEPRPEAPKRDWC